MQISNITVSKHFKNNYLSEYNVYLFNVYLFLGLYSMFPLYKNGLSF